MQAAHSMSFLGVRECWDVSCEPISESSPLCCVSPHQITKLLVEISWGMGRDREGRHYSQKTRPWRWRQQLLEMSVFIKHIRTFGVEKKYTECRKILRIPCGWEGCLFPFTLVPICFPPFCLAV